MSTASASSTSLSSVSPSSAAQAIATTTTATSTTTQHTIFNEALFLSSLTSKPAHPQPFTFRRSFLSPPLPKRSTEGGDEKDKESVEGAVDVLRFGRHHPRRAELQGEWEEELIAQLQKEEEDRDGEKAQKKGAEEVRADKHEKLTAAVDESTASSSQAATITTASVSASSPSLSSSSQSARSPTPTTPLSAADASLSSVLHLLAADKQPTLPERICNLLTSAIAFHATLMQQFATHVLQPQQQSDNNNSSSTAAQLSLPPSISASAPSSASSSVAEDESVTVKQEGEPLSSLPQFAAKYYTELTGSLDGLKEADTLLTEWKKDTSLSTSDLAACDSLFAHVLTPLSATFTSLLSPNPSLAAVASPSSLVASFLLAKRGRGRLHKCDKHRRWKKKCPPDCPDKPQGKWDDGTAMDEDEDDEDDEDEEADDRARQVRPSHEQSVGVSTDKKRKIDGQEREEHSLVRAQSTAKRAHDVVKAVHAFQPIATATAITPTSAAVAAASGPSPGTPSPSAASPSPSKEEVVRARETALAAQVIPSAVPLTAASPMPHSAQMLAHPVARPASLPSTQQTTLYAAQPLVMQSAMPARPNALYAFTPANQLAATLSSASFAHAQPATHATHTLVTLEQLTAMQQQGNTFRIVQSAQQPQHTPAHTHTATAYAQPYIPPQMSVVYANAGGGGGQAGGGQGQPYTYSPVGGYQLQQQ